MPTEPAATLPRSTPPTADPTSTAWLRPLRWTGPPMNEQSPTTAPEGAFALPVGTVTFLLTDVEGSTLAWQSNGPAMGAAIARHYEILDAAVTAYGGVRPQEQGEGDSIVAAFGRASDALAAAADAQRVLAAEAWTDTLAEPLRVRMAVHTGEAQMRNEANYVGQAIIRTARLRAIAYGGQVLVSQAARDLAVDQRGSELEFVDLGIHRLKDLARPEHVWQLAAPGLERTFPPLRSLDITPNNLPLDLSSFIGRTAEIATVTKLVEQNRLVVVNGSGGAGKTRLALQVAAQLSDRFEDGVWWVELAPLDSTSVLRTIASIVAVKEPDKLAERLAGRHALLVLDNCEHVLDVVGPLTHAIHTRCPNVHVLATSRGALDVPGEITWRVPPLGLPEPGAAFPIERLAQFDAVRLFLERARRARPTFELTTDNGPTIAELCSRVDGIPLAIELAAARTKSLTPGQILTGLEDSLRLLTGGSRVVLPRQQTLEASIDWSHNLLGPAERVLLRRLSAFAGGCDLPAAEAVCADDVLLPEMGVLDALERLIDQSLVTVDEKGLTARYRVLETVRQYGARQLAAAGETEAVNRRHAQWYVHLSSQFGPLAEGPREQDCIDRLLPERENIAAVLARLRDADDGAGLAALALVLMSFWHHSNQMLSGSEWTTAAIDRLRKEPSATGGWLHYARAKHDFLAARHGHQLADLTFAIAWADQSGDGRLAGRARILLAIIRSATDAPGAAVLLDEAAERCRSAGDLYGLADAQLSRLSVDYYSGNLLGVREALRRAEPHVLASGSVTMLGTWICVHLGTARLSGDCQGVTEALRRLPVKRLTAPSPMYLAAVIPALVFLQTETGELGVARDELLEHVRFHNAVGQVGPSPEELLKYVRSLEISDNHMWALAQRGQVARAKLVRSEFALSRQQVDETLGHAASNALLYRLISDVHLIGVQAALALGDVADARRRLEAMGPLLGAGANRIDVTEGHLAEALICRAEGDLAAAEVEVHSALRIAVEQSLMRELLLSLELLAGLAAAHGSWQEAGRLAGAAQQQREDRKLGLRIEPHASQHGLDQAEARAALGDSAFDSAFAEGRRLSLDDAVAFAQRARGARGRPTIGWHSLTPTERRVADLARLGHTNVAIGRELLMGPETVKTHLSRVFAKLGVKNRTQLAVSNPPSD